MSQRGEGIMMKQGEELMRQLLLHTRKFGGTTCAIYGSLGAGKSTLLRFIVKKVAYVDGTKIKKETVVWRGRTVNDYWNSFDPARCILWFQENDYSEEYGRVPSFNDEYGNPIDINDLPVIMTYHDIPDLYNGIKTYGLGKINIVYETREYSFNEVIKDILKKRSMVSSREFEDKLVDIALFWYEFFYYLIANKTNEFLTVIADEADDLIMQSPGQLRWHAQLWLKDSMKSFRAKHISFFLATHHFSDLDGRLLSKINYGIYLKGSRLPNTSQLWRNKVKLVPRGKGYVEADTYGMFAFDDMKSKPHIVVHFNETEELKQRMEQRKEEADELRRKKHQGRSEEGREHLRQHMREVRSNAKKDQIDGMV